MNTRQISLGIILAYPCSMLAITVLNDRKKRQKNTERFFLANRGVSSVPLPLIMIAVMQSTFASLGASGMYYTHGASYTSVVLNQVWVVLMVIYFGNKIRKLVNKNGYMFLGDYLRDRFDSKYLEVLASCICASMTMVFLAMQYVGNARTMNIVSGDAISYLAIILISVVFPLLHVLVGGVGGVVLLDAAQAVILLVGITVAAWITIVPVGGIQVLFTQITDKMPELLSRPGPQGIYTDKYWTMQFIVLPFGVWFHPHIWMKSSMTKGEDVLAKSAISIPLFQILTHGFAALFTGLAGHLLLQPQQVGAADNVLPLPMATRSKWFIATLVMAATMAAGISTINVMPLVFSRIVSQGLILINEKGRISEKKNIILSRTTVFIIVVICGVMALNPPGTLVQIVQDVVYTGLAWLTPALLPGTYRKGCTKTGAACGMSAGTAILFGARVTNAAPFGWPGFMWEFLTNILLTALVSLMTK